MKRWKTTTILSAVFALGCLGFLGFRVYRLWAWDHALEAAFTVCRSPCNLDEDGVHTLALAVCDGPDPALELRAMLDGMIEDPAHRAACAECERAILGAAMSGAN